MNKNHFINRWINDKIGYDNEQVKRDAASLTHTRVGELKIQGGFFMAFYNTPLQEFITLTICHQA